MSFLQYLKIIHNSYPKELDELDENDIIRIEKILKSEIRTNPDLDINELNGFLETLKNNVSEILFLIQNGFLETVIGETWVLKKYSEKVDDYRLKIFVSTYFTNLLNELFGVYFSKEKYNNIRSLLLYKDILPDTTLLYIERQIEVKLDIIINAIESKKIQFFDLNTPIIKVALIVPNERIQNKLKRIRDLSFAALPEPPSNKSTIWFIILFIFLILKAIRIFTS